MYKALTLPRTRKQAVAEDPSTSVTVLSLKPTWSLSPNTIRKRRAAKSKQLEVAPPAASDGNDSGSDATPATTGGEPRPARPSVTVTGSHTLPARSSPKTAKKKLNSILKGGRNLIFRNKNESAPLEVEKSLDFHRVASVRVATMQSSKSNHDETDIADDASPADEWSVTATCERVKKISVIESVYRDGDGAVAVITDHDVKSTSSDQDEFLDATSVPSPTPESSDFSLPWSHRKASTVALKEEIMRKTSCDHAAYIWSKVDSRERMVNGQDRSASNKNDLLFKILVIGELGTGKTSIIKRYVHQFFSQHYRATIGVDFALKVLAWDANTTIRLQLWDIAGQERFGNMTRVYYKEAVGALIVFDVTRQGTFDAVNKWKQDLDSKVQLPDGEAIPCVLLANKCDQPKEGIVNNQHKMDEFCKENQFVGWFETSAKENVNIDEAANCLVSKIIQNDMKRHLERETVNGTGVISIELDKKDSKRKFCNFC